MSSASRHGRLPVTLGAALVILAAAPVAAAAQGNLSTQGFGYGSGQLSTRAYGTGGALAEIDAWSPVNPAMVTQFGLRTLSFQIEPEFRRVTNGSGTESTNIARYPVVFGAMPIRNGWAASLGASTLLDRTWRTENTLVQEVGGEEVTSTAREASEGAINDLRLAIGYGRRLRADQPTSALRFGLGLHALTGRNLVSTALVFEDSTRFSPLTAVRKISYGGNALSAGVQLATPIVSVGASYRLGGRITAELGDSTVSRADVPDRFGVTFAYTGIQGTVLAARMAHDGWSSLSPLGETATGVDGWDTSLGADVAGPRWGTNLVRIRAGVRSRTLPFQAAGNQVTERSGTLGTGLSFAQGRVAADLAAIYSSRNASLEMRERAWTFSIGLTARP